MYLVFLMMKAKLDILCLSVEKTILELQIYYTGMNIMLLSIIYLDCLVILLNIMNNLICVYDVSDILELLKFLYVHKQLCTREDYMSVVHVLPTPDSEESHIKFKQFRNTSQAPFVIYADFESILERVDRQNKRTHYDQQHKVCAAAAILCFYIPEMNNKLMLFSGPNTLENFLNKLIEWETMCMEYLRLNCPMRPLNFQQEIDHDNAQTCYLCRQPFQVVDPRGGKVRDHDHITGYYLGPAHRQCNIERPVKYLIPVFFHNFRGYDFHLIVHQFRYHKNREIKVIGQNMEKYLQIQWGKNMVFRDSLQFLCSSLEALASSLAKSGRDNFKHLHEIISDRYPESPVELVERKGIFCYDYLDSFERFNEPTLPTREQFFSNLYNAECKQEDHDHATTSVGRIQMPNIGGLYETIFNYGYMHTSGCV